MLWHKNQGAGGLVIAPPSPYWDIDNINTSPYNNFYCTDDILGAANGSNGLCLAYDDDTRLVYANSTGASLTKMTSAGALDTLAIENRDTSLGYTNNNGLWFGNNGTELWGARNTLVVGRVTLGTAYDITTHGTAVTLDVSTNVSALRGLFVKPDGAKFWLVDNSSIYQYSMSTAFDLANATFDHSTAYSNAGSNNGCWFKSDGTKVYSMRDNGQEIFEHPLSTAWDTSTKGSSTTYTLPSSVTDWIGTVVQGGTLSFNSSGTVLYILQQLSAGGLTIKLTLSTAWDLSTLSWAGSDDTFYSGTGVQCVRLGDSDNKLFALVNNGTLTNDTVHQWPLSTAGDITTTGTKTSFSVAAQDNNPTGLAFGDNGQKMYIVGTSTDTIYQYTLSTAWDVTTASYDSKSLYIGGEETLPQDLAISPDGDVVWLTGISGDEIEEYTLSTAWDISTGTYNAQSTQLNYQNPRMFVKPDGTKIFLCKQTNGVLVQIDVPTPWDITSIVDTGQDGSKHIDYFFEKLINNGNCQTLCFNSNGSRMYAQGARLTVQYDLE